MVYLGEEAAVGELRVRKYLVQLQQRGGRLGPGAGGELEDFVASLVLHPVYEDGVYLVRALASFDEGGEARLFQQFGTPDHREQQLPLALGGNGVGHVAVLARQNGDGIASVPALVLPARAVPPADQASVGVHDRRELVQRGERLYLRHFHGASDAGSVAVAQRHEDAGVGVKARQVLRLVAGNHQRLAVFVAGQVQETSEREADQWTASPPRVRSGRAERGQRCAYHAVRQGRIHCSFVVYENVRALQQPAERRRAIGGAAIERYAALAHIEVQVQRARLRV